MTCPRRRGHEANHASGGNSPLLPRTPGTSRPGQTDSAWCAMQRRR
jgi:hypothetical protein